MSSTFNKLVYKYQIFNMFSNFSVYTGELSCSYSQQLYKVFINRQSHNVLHTKDQNTKHVKYVENMIYVFNYLHVNYEKGS